MLIIFRIHWIFSHQYFFPYKLQVSICFREEKKITSSCHVIEVMNTRLVNVLLFCNKCFQYAYIWFIEGFTGTVLLQFLRYENCKIYVILVWCVPHSSLKCTLRFQFLCIMLCTLFSSGWFKLLYESDGDLCN